MKLYSKIAFYTALISVAVVILSPLLVIKYADNASGVPFWVEVIFKINSALLGVSFFYLWINAWILLFRFWSVREKNENNALLLLMIFAGPLGAIYFYLRRERHDPAPIDRVRTNQ